MEMTLQDLEMTAQELATAEIKARLCQSGEFPMYQREIQGLKNQADWMRALLPEEDRKEYWWDVPFTPGAPEEAEDDTFHMEDGFYFESGEWEIVSESRCRVMRVRDKERAIKDLLSYYVTFERSYILLYLDKKKMRRLYKYPAQVRTIYHGQWSRSTYSMRTPVEVDSSYQSLLWESCQQDMEEIDARLREQLAESEERWDRYETFSNAWKRNAAMTNQEAWGLGKMSTEDYFSGSVWRDYAREEIKARAREEKQARQWKLEQMMAEYRRYYRQTERTAVGENCRLRLMAVGEAVYCQGELVALVPYQGTEAVYEFKCASDFQAEQLTGKVYGAEKMFEKRIAKLPLFEYLLQAYGNALPLYQVLDPRPKNCPDGAWRMWAEVRWAQTLNLLRSIR